MVLLASASLDPGQLSFSERLANWRRFSPFGPTHQASAGQGSFHWLTAHIHHLLTTIGTDAANTERSWGGSAVEEARHRFGLHVATAAFPEAIAEHIRNLGTGILASCETATSALAVDFENNILRAAADVRSCCDALETVPISERERLKQHADLCFQTLAELASPMLNVQGARS